ncbi:hypothetical protein [Paraburkholderia atlantica]|uniref:hypothetical protein n=1 Tax=Paraburkholderia atlantica TaxID=2654982 RepID=UPI0017CF348C|nr:hypothetical protein [Paraburkholderia atlantica]MBB5509467.1 hypothetical protein [Paraburkholderia atlantica]
MTRLTCSGDWTKSLAVLCLAGWFGGCSLAAGHYGQDSQMTQPDMTLWQTIDSLVQQIPFTKEKVESVLATHLVGRDTSGDSIENTAFQFYVGGPAKMADGVVVGNVDLRVRHTGGHPGFLALGKLSGECVTLAVVRAHYSNLKVTDSPRGQSLDETTAYSAFLPWGTLSFAFAERNRDCLEGVSFDPKIAAADNAVK